MQTLNFDEVVGQITARDPRYTAGAYHFVREALDHTQKIIGKAPKGQDLRHVSGKQLLDGIRDFALHQFGPMAITVLEEWGITRCEDFGEIVFNMVETSLLSKTEDDSRDDFKSVYTFEEAFRHPYLPKAKLPAPKPELKNA